MRPGAARTFRIMRIVRRRAGITLADLIIAIAFVGIVLTIAAPRIVWLRSQGSVRSARDAAAAAIERGRSLAVSRGSARVRVEPGAGTLAIEAPVGVGAGPVLRLKEGWGVTLGVGGSAAPAVIDFNAMGLGVVASRTITFTRGGATAGLAISSFGRVRRW